MLSLEEIKRYFPEKSWNNQRDMLREYVQYLILKIIFKHSIGSKLCFIGGTALRIVYNTQRFSEDIDFDNNGFELSDWEDIGQEIQKQLNFLGLETEINSRKNKTIFHHDIKFTDILFKLGLSPHKNQKLKIKVDSENQGINYEARVFTLNKFNIVHKIRTLPLDIALSQKIRAFLDREMGRDVFDISSIAPQTKPNYDYLEQALNITDAKELKEKLIERCNELDFKNLVTRAKPFLFDMESAKHIELFPDFVKQHEF